MLFYRIVSGFCLIFLVLAVLYYGIYPTMVLIFALAFLMGYEIERLLDRQGLWIGFFLGLFGVFVGGSVFFPRIFYLEEMKNIQEGLWGFVFLYGFLFLCWIYWGYRRYFFWFLGAFLYLGLSIYALGKIYLLDEGALFLYLLCVVAAFDSGGYFVGRWLQGAKLWPAVSPNKTWWGFMGGCFCSVLVSILYCYGDFGGDISLLSRYSVLELMVLSFLFACIAQGGDLFESYVKRFFHVKDSGTLIPGHGGILDRIDGLVFVMFAGYCIF